MHTIQWESVSEAAKDLVRRMLTLDPNKRITIQDVLNHRWLKVTTRLSMLVYLSHIHSSCLSINGGAHV